MVVAMKLIAPINDAPQNRNTDDPQRLPESFTWPGKRPDGAQRRIGSPAGYRRSALHEECCHHHHQCQKRGPEGEHVQHRERHVLSANLDRKEIISKTALRRRGQHEEHHDRAMHGHQRQVQFRRHDAARRAGGPKLFEECDLGVRIHHVKSHQHRQRHPQKHREQRQKIVLNADDFVIEAENIAANKTLRRVVRHMPYR